MSVLDQIEKANEQQFCQVCRELLSRVSQEDIAPSVLYPIQLLLWGIKAHPSEITYPKGRSLDQMQRVLAAAAQAEPEQVLGWLLYPPEGSWLVQQTEATQQFREMTPLVAAKQLSENLTVWWEAVRLSRFPNSGTMGQGLSAEALNTFDKYLRSELPDQGSIDNDEAEERSPDNQYEHNAKVDTQEQEPLLHASGSDSGMSTLVTAGANPISNVPARIDQQLRKRLSAGTTAPRTKSTRAIRAIIVATRVLGKETRVRLELFRGKWRAIYRTRPIIARIRVAGDIGGAVHELGHGMWALLNDWNGKGIRKAFNLSIRNELIGIGKALYPVGRPVGGFEQEGFADFLRQWVTMRNEAVKHAPKMVDWWENTFLPAMPDFKEAIEKAQHQATNYRLQGETELVRSQMLNSPTPKAPENRESLEMKPSETGNTILNSSLTAIMKRLISQVQRQSATTKVALLLSAGVILGGLLGPWLTSSGKWEIKHVESPARRESATYKVNERTGETYLLTNGSWVKVNTLAPPK